MPVEPAVEPRADELRSADDGERLRSLEFRTLRIYGEDDRLDVGPGATAELALRAPEERSRSGTALAWAEQVLSAGRAVALMVTTTELTPQPDGSFQLASLSHNARVLEEHGVPLCAAPRARYQDQPTAGLCTAWLAAPTLVVTARHCIAGREATEIAFVFGWQQRAEGSFPGTPALLEGVQVYRGRAFHARGAGGAAGDYAVIELDRPVPAASGIAPLGMRRSGRPRKGEPLYLLGSPRGLPLKFAGGAEVKLVHSELPLLRADVDAFQGNSGSPVLSSLDHRVVGILVRGKSDFFNVGDPPCAVEARTTFTRSGETVLGCPAFQQHIPRTAADSR